MTNASHGAAENPRRVRLLKVLSVVAGVITVVVGLVVLIGWAFDLTILKSVFLGLVSMKANTAFSFVLSGLSFEKLLGRTETLAAGKDTGNPHQGS